MTLLTRRVSLRRQLNTFDTTSLVVGSAIGADIFVIPSLIARIVGPVSILIWFVGAIIAIVIALCFAYCATILPKVGGSYAYSREVAGPFPGFMVGWALLLAEWFTLAVFPVAFVQYFLTLAPDLPPSYQVLLKAAFTVTIILTNIYGVKAASRFNDILTMAKLGPLFFLVCLGIAFFAFRPSLAISHFEPFLIGNASGVGQALVLIIWAYAGFELSCLPADEIENPRKTLPKALFLGMLIVAAFYIVTNIGVMAIVDQATLRAATAPLSLAAAKALSFSPTLAVLGGLILTFGALASILGVDESGTIGTSRLAFAMSLDGMLPRAFSKLHPTSKTPYVSIIVLCSTAFIASLTNSLSALINASVFLLSFAYLATCISAYYLEKKRSKSTSSLGNRLVILFGVAFSIVLMTQVSTQQVFLAMILVGVGVPVYVLFAPKKDITELKREYLSRQAILERAYHQGEVFLAYVIRHTKWRIYKMMKIDRAWKVDEPKQT
jgi:APA family basic amino acid/polyamine antiporter